MTKTKMIIEHLLSKGCKEVRTISRKYRKFKSPNGTTFYWVGKSGALRKGTLVSNSLSLTYMVKKYFTKEALKQKGQN